MAEPVLLPRDFDEPPILRLKAHYEARLQELRVKNDARLDADKTARLRGRIFEVKSLLALVTNKPAPQESDDA